MLELRLEFLLGVSVVVVHRCEEVPLKILPYAVNGLVVVMDPCAADLLLDKRGGLPLAVVLKEFRELFRWELRLAYPLLQA